ncbi:DEAD/DEAH box helicase family protein [Tenacibaculum sp. AHE15PA]|uniref:DEAD/DEAH box helicase n=1 Tax=unclassified Tenacibaculum TaxID=2635139 RepID=UPI001C4F03BB|nr:MULTISPECIES: DEAD/DEAH box helicase family protein [unclassified Tenacibaculum]QXP74658.1 DEAD/DEAH box helicase family protein [Tenacibaculum sp. AHE14PA]QXP76169.1 DEAD/DEAH box helicase family protein [Tenacibaculum sp. AHE15PA]
MELKSYQQKVIENLEEYLQYVQEHKNVSTAFNQYWEDKIGRYNPLDNTGMQPYKNNIPNSAHVCIKVPTAGGKTFIAVNALRSIFSAYDTSKTKAVIWLVPWSNLLQQTVNALSNPEHPYRQKLNALFNHKVEIYQKEDLLQGSNFNPTVVKEQLSIFVLSFASLRARNKEDRKVYQENGQLESFVPQYANRKHLLDDVDDTALINVIRSLHPVLVVDESHNAESDLSVDMLKNLNPSFILDLTATPKDNSNIVSLVPAIELKKEHMVKLPVIVYNNHDKTEVINNALHLQRKLENLAIKQEKDGGKYIRPIVLFQAQPKTKNDNTTFEKLKEQLLSLGIPENQIKIKTANIDELKSIPDLQSKDCEVRYIITINALKEGWDCPFAYILASLADKSSAVDVEQILGRVLRQPYVQKHKAFQLNLSYVLTASAKFNDTLQSIVEGLKASGFSGNEHRVSDKMTEEEKQTEVVNPVDSFLFPEQQKETEEETIDKGRISFDPNAKEEDIEDTSVITEIETMAEEQNKELEQQIQEQEKQPVDENIFQEMGDKVKRYRVKEANKEIIDKIDFPQFFLKVAASDIFGTDQELLNRESLLKDFKLSDEDIKIDFDKISSDLYKVDLTETVKDNYTPDWVKIEESQVKDPIAEYILAKPKDAQISDITHQIMQIIGNMYPIPDQEIKVYVGRILNGMNAEQMRDILVRKWSYTDKIKAHIRKLSDAYAETRFMDLIKSKRITAKENWKLAKEIVPGNVGSSIGNSLYEKEGTMNNFEERVIMEIGTSSNIEFWHRNLERGKGFYINGFKANHYPDFILRTKSGKTILIETKGDHLDGSDSEGKCRLGNEWEKQAGHDFSYFMIFDKKEVDGAFTLDKAKELISGM